jgi:hypothetical protein
MIIKTEIKQILDNGGTDKDQLDAIKEIVLNPEKKNKRDFAAIFIKAAAILACMMDDYQMDKLHPEFCGFLNTSDEGHDPVVFRFLVQNLSMFEGFIHRNGFRIEKATVSEFIIHLDEK